MKTPFDYLSLATNDQRKHLLVHRELQALRFTRRNYLAVLRTSHSRAVLARKKRISKVGKKRKVKLLNFRHFHMNTPEIKLLTHPQYRNLTREDQSPSTFTYARPTRLTFIGISLFGVGYSFSSLHEEASRKSVTLVRGGGNYSNVLSIDHVLDGQVDFQLFHEGKPSPTSKKLVVYGWNQFKVNDIAQQLFRREPYNHQTKKGIQITRAVNQTWENLQESMSKTFEDNTYLLRHEINNEKRVHETSADLRIPALKYSQPQKPRFTKVSLPEKVKSRYIPMVRGGSQKKEWVERAEDAVIDEKTIETMDVYDAENTDFHEMLRDSSFLEPSSALTQDDYSEFVQAQRYARKWKATHESGITSSSLAKSFTEFDSFFRPAPWKTKVATSFMGSQDPRSRHSTGGLNPLSRSRRPVMVKSRKNTEVQNMDTEYENILVQDHPEGATMTSSSLLTRADVLQKAFDQVKKRLHKPARRVKDSQAYVKPRTKRQKKNRFKKEFMRMIRNDLRDAPFRERTLSEARHLVLTAENALNAVQQIQDPKIYEISLMHARARLKKAHARYRYVKSYQTPKTLIEVPHHEGILSRVGIKTKVRSGRSPSAWEHVDERIDQQKKRNEGLLQHDPLATSTSHRGDLLDRRDGTPEAPAVSFPVPSSTQKKHSRYPSEPLFVSEGYRAPYQESVLEIDAMLNFRQSLYPKWNIYPGFNERDSHLQEYAREMPPLHPDDPLRPLLHSDSTKCVDWEALSPGQKQRVLYNASHLEMNASLKRLRSGSFTAKDSITLSQFDHKGPFRQLDDVSGFNGHASEHLWGRRHTSKMKTPGEQSREKAADQDYLQEFNDSRPYRKFDDHRLTYLHASQDDNEHKKSYLSGDQLLHSLAKRP